MPETLLTCLREGGKRALADALSKVEASQTAAGTIDLLDEAYHHGHGHVIGITGPPGVGKSTLIAALIAAYRARDETVGVIAVDPSSGRSGGALLGDRVRIDTDPADAGIFVRSMAARDRLGGLAAITSPSVVLMRAVYDRVIVETVGVGQSETEIATVADSVIFCVQPGSGDSLQYMKAGIAEIPDIALITKADLGDIAIQARRDLRSALTTTGRTLGEGLQDSWKIPVLSIAAGDKQDMVGLVKAIDDHIGYLRNGPLADRRANQAQTWLENAIREAYGREGLKIANTLPGGIRVGGNCSPFRRLHTILRLLTDRFHDGSMSSGEPAS